MQLMRQERVSRDRSCHMKHVTQHSGDPRMTEEREMSKFDEMSLERLRRVKDSSDT